MNNDDVKRWNRRIDKIEEEQPFPSICVKGSEGRIDYRCCNKCGRKKKEQYDVLIPYMTGNSSLSIHLCKRCMRQLIANTYKAYKGK